MLTMGRQTALKALGIFRRDRRRSETVINSVLSEDMDARERALAVNIFYGVIPVSYTHLFTCTKFIIKYVRRNAK